MGENCNASHNDIETRGMGVFSQFSAAIGKSCSVWASLAVLLFSIIFFVVAFMSDTGINSMLSGGSFQKSIFTSKFPKKPQNNIEIPFQCLPRNMTQTCPEDYPKMVKTNDSTTETCPEYFRWIHEDLRPWSHTGISKAMIEASKKYADFRLVVIKGKVYVEKYRGVFQTRDVFTIWGILQLLRLYPGKLPDFDILFACGDRPMILKHDHQIPNAVSPPPVFHYCKDDFSMDIIFPDWSFWGWPEINIKPWVTLSKEIEEGNQKIKWIKREPYAYWKGNIRVSGIRQDLMRCNPSKRQDWNARIFDLDWGHEISKGFSHSNLAKQCTHRYKIYVEGVAWSVSEKYILACDSMTLLIIPRYYDIFTRGLIPLKHYWPIREKTKCNSIKFAVDWGNNNKQKAQEIGKEGSKFILENAKMIHVYDYMFHVLSGYANLLKYQPTVPPGAVEVCSETQVCATEGLIKTYKMESTVKGPAVTSPCILPPPYDPPTLREFLERKENLTRQVEFWEAKGVANQF